MAKQATSLAKTTTLSSRVALASQRSDKWIPDQELITEALPTGVRMISIDDVDYPARLRNVAFAPRYLYVNGPLDINQGEAPIAIVGSRNSSLEGIQTAHQIADELAQRGHPIVSGLAAGIDTAAHEGALATGGHTAAVVGTSIDRTFPAANASLQDRIVETGIVISQFSLGQNGSKTTFPARNAVIAGITAVSLLVELQERSGTRVEANLALEQNKPVLLWAPLLESATWAQEFAQHPLVSFVSTSNEIIAATKDKT